MSDSVILAGCVPLAKAESYQDKTVDLVGVIADFRQPMSSKGTDWTVTFTLCDKTSLRPEAGLCVRIFRPTMELLPRIRSNGDIILLRNIRIKYYGNRLMAMSYFSTSWVISYLPNHPNAIPLTSSHPSTIKPRPQDLEYMRSLQTWWTTSGIASASSNQTTGVVNDRKRKFSLIRDMQFDCFYDIVGFVAKTFPGLGNFTIYITDYSKNTMLHAYEWGGRAGAGGDNDDYDYTGRGRTGGNHKWPGPWGQYTLQVTLWDEHAAAARQTVYEGIYLKLENVRAKRNGDGKLEGALHGDKRFPDRVHLHVMNDMSDPRIRQVIQRKKEYTRRFESDKLRYEEEMQAENSEMKQKEVEKQVRKDEGNKYVRCRVSNQPVTPISQILNPTDTAAPFVNRNYHIYCRVIDYLPKNLQDFSVPNQPRDTQLEGDNKDKRAKSWVWRFALLVEGNDGATMRLIVEGEDGVHLLKIDPVDLRKDTRALQILREKLFVLWGSLEERKTQRLLRQEKGSRSAATPTLNQSRKRNKHSQKSNAKSRKYDELGKPRRRSDADSGSDADESVDEDTGGENNEEKCGKMFEACVKEYGVPVGKEWKRMHRLFGTVIL